MKTGQNCGGSECPYSEDDSKEELTSSGNTPRGDVLHGGIVKGDNFPGKSSKTSSDDSGDGNERLCKISSKTEDLLAKKGISWPWKGHEHSGPDKGHMNPLQFHDKQDNDQIHLVGPESIIIPDYQDSDSTQESRYEVTGNWWSFNNDSFNSLGSSLSSNSSAIERVDLEADCLDYEILWEDLVLGEQVGQGMRFSLCKCFYLSANVETHFSCLLMLQNICACTRPYLSNMINLLMRIWNLQFLNNIGLYVLLWLNLYHCASCNLQRTLVSSMLQYRIGGMTA